jgi:hypothetical protein
MYSGKIAVPPGGGGIEMSSLLRQKKSSRVIISEKIYVKMKSLIY